jgi:hypothetical protein
MSVRAEVAAAQPTEIVAVLVRTELLLRIDAALAPSCGRQERWQGAKSLWTGIGRLLTGVTQRFMDEASKGLGLFGVVTVW